ncbi:MAG TPA: thioredoxin family protein [Methylophilaceae bacterium]|nr:thioredoxin family protein [Methylophilaceae bacterium]
MENISSEQIEEMNGSLLLEFGAEWCDYCRAAQPLIKAALAKHPDIPHIKIEDGKGKRLGRQYGIKLWPSLIFIRDGKEISRLVRPQNADIIAQHLADLEKPPSPDSQ